MAYTLFNEQDHIRNYAAHSFLHLYSSNARLLMRMFEDQQAYISDLGVVLLNTFDEYQEFQTSKYAYFANELNKSGYVKEITSKVRVLWSDKVADVNPESIVEISHGGGYRYISDFLEGKNRGYKLEGGGVGLQVSPVKTNRDQCYSLRCCPRFDTPAIFKAKIKAKYLDAANNDYEAGLRPKYVQYLTSITVEKWNASSKQICESCPPIDWEKINKTYSPDQAKRFKTSFDRGFCKTQ